MRIPNKLLIGILILALIIIIIGVFGLLVNNQNYDVLINSGGGLFILTGTFLLIKNGHFINSREYRISRIGISIILLGVMFKIMHWKYSAIILGIGCLSFGLIYGIYLSRRINTINWTNWLKLLFLLLFFVGKFIQWMHWKYSDEFLVGALLTMIILVAEYILKSRTIIKMK